jgi:hypothetical protein
MTTKTEIETQDDVALRAFREENPTLPLDFVFWIIEQLDEDQFAEAVAEYNSMMETCPECGAAIFYEPHYDGCSHRQGG